jgi:uncharacterized membrane protein
MLGYDWPRLHAALNDFPAALLLGSVLFDLLGAVNKRDSLKAAGFWTLIVGVLGTGAAIVAGLLAEDRVEHSDRAHAIMGTHETLAYIVLAIFGLLALWRIVRKGVWNDREQPVALTAGVIGVALMVYTAKLGGNLVFDHALGIKSATMEAVVQERAGGHEHGETEAEEHEHAAPAPDTTKAAGDTAKAAAPAAVDTASHRR